jgi:hypothetical protein
MDYRAMYDGKYVGSWDIAGKDTTVTIAKVEAVEVIGAGDKHNKRPVLSFTGAQKGLVLNKTNGKIVANMYGNNVEKWVGKKITLYATTCSAFGQTVDCIRVRPQPPRGQDGGE